LLKDVAEEQKFKVEYFDVQKSDTDECFSCITSIGIEPVAIFHGRGGSKTQARKNAAERALEFLEIAIRG
jgi:dsRNA-specific ribonuclease